MSFVYSHGGWLESRFHFRFANRNPPDPKRRGFGALHVLNDDIVAPSNGFGFHPHRDQEIFSYILEGELSHEDSEGHKLSQRDVGSRLDLQIMLFFALQI